MYALVEIKGKQYKAVKDGKIKVDSLNMDDGAEVSFDSVLLVGEEGKVKVGEPFVKGAKVTATVLGDKKDKKIIVYKYKKRKGYKLKRGHRQNHTFIQVKDIVAG